MNGPLPPPLTPEDAAARRLRVDRLRKAVERGDYHVAADLVAEALLQHLRRTHRDASRP